MNMIHLLLVGAGGCIGSMARYLTVLSIDRKLNTVIPYGTFTVNVVGSFLLGFVLAWATRKTGAQAEYWKYLLGTGFCGGFTTFSAFAAENLAMLEQKLPGTVFLYVLTSVVGGLLAVWSGFAIARAIF